MLYTLITSLFFFLVSLAAPTKPGFVEHNVTRSDGTVTTVYFHESFVPDEKAVSLPSTAAVATPSAVQNIHERFIVFWHSVPWVGPFCSLVTRTCSTTDHSALWDDCIDLMTGFDTTPGYWNVSYFQTRNNYGILGYYNDCILSLARDDDNINDYAQISTVDVTTRMRNAGRSCGIADHDNIIHVGATISLTCPNRGGTTALLKLWIHSRDGVKSLPSREEAANPPTDQVVDKHMTAIWTPDSAPPPACTVQSRNCEGLKDSALWEDCKVLQGILEFNPGFWTLSSFEGNNYYNLLKYNQRCAISVSRNDTQFTEPALITTTDLVNILRDAADNCTMSGSAKVPRLGAWYGNDCVNLPNSGGNARLNVWIHSVAGELDSGSTKSDVAALDPAGSGAGEPPELLTMVWNATPDHQPKCTMGPYTCKTKSTSPTQDDCVMLREVLYDTPGFWNLSSWPAAGGYDEIIRHQSCVVYLARPDRSQEEAQFAATDAIFVLTSAWYQCNKDYDSTNRVAAVFQDFCPNLPSGTAPINVKVDSPDS
ncbi:uncharacterized protein PG998_011818 [Apiospora kogelbergensis]|uniref:uncharacterized protein n=1 Tax=Apiospora kogelbergensis TaxID=1337665 RepID=UPI00312E5314